MRLIDRADLIDDPRLKTMAMRVAHRHEMDTLAGQWIAARPLQEVLDKLNDVGVSVAPVPDQRLYDTIYQERYMGLPQENAAGYKVGSAINFAEGLQGKLLVIHGSGDNNVHVQGTERLINRLIELGKPFDSMIYPNRTHSISEGPGTTPHIYKLIARYFYTNLPAGPR